MNIQKNQYSSNKLNSIDIFLEYDWMVKYNLELNWNKGII